MRANIAALMACLAVAGCGSLRGRPPEEPAYRPVALIGGVEVRQYDARIAAETLVDGDAVAARGIGYRRLADYVGGANRDGRKLAMTVPLAQAAEGPGHWRIRLFLPAGATLAALPPPSDPAVALVTLPPETFAVLRFSGAASAEAVAQRTGDLVSTLEGSAWRPAGAPVAWFYDPPAAPHRNEVAIPVSPK